MERKLVWIMGSPRSGSTWLMNLMRVHPRVLAIDEPRIGMHLGLFTPDVLGGPTGRYPREALLVTAASREQRDYFFSDRYEHSWRPLLRSLIVERLGTQAMDMARVAGVRDPVTVVKEPNGSQVADLILATLPSSRLIFLLRDGRDVVDSALDGATSGSWATERYGGGLDTGIEDRVRFVEDRSHKWVLRTEAVQRAYSRLPPEGRRMLRYERLRADPAAELRELLGWLDLEVAEQELQSAVARLAFEAVPEEQRGPGRFHRAASPGRWRESLTTAEQRVAQEIMGPKLSELGYA